MAAATTKETWTTPTAWRAWDGDFVSQGNLIPVLMSREFVLLYKLYESLKCSERRRAAHLLKSKSLREGAEALKRERVPLIAKRHPGEHEHHEGALTENIDHNSCVR